MVKTSLWQHPLLAVWYMPRSTTTLPTVELPHLPNLTTIESFLWVLLILILLKPLLKVFVDQKRENERLNTLKISAIIGLFAAAIHLYRLVSHS